jgi:hypothetical protein
MTDRFRLALRALLALTCVAAVAAPGSAGAAPVPIDLRVEGRNQTIFEGRVTTDGHDVTTASGGTHRCDGTNNGEHPTPGPTATAALDDAARTAGFTWDATYDSGFDDYLISRIGPDSTTSSEFWTYTVNFQDPGVGGCQVHVMADDDVLWAFDSFGKPLLSLAAPGTAVTGEEVTLTVVDGQDGSPEAGVSVAGATTGADGKAILRFDSPGIFRLKGERAGAIRSNAAVLCVDPPGAPACTSGDRVSPSAQMRVPRYVSDVSRSRTFPVAWQGIDDTAGSGVRGFEVDVREAGGEFRALAAGTSAVSAPFRGAFGTQYEFRVTAVDRAGNRSARGTDSVIVPMDDRDREDMFFRGRWRRLERPGAYGRFVMRAPRRGPTLRVAFSGDSVALIGRRMRRGGRLRVTVNGRSRVLRLRGTPRHRRVLFRRSGLGPGRHLLRLRALGGGPVEIDAVGALH